MPSTPSVHPLPVVKPRAANVFQIPAASTTKATPDASDVNLRKDEAPAQTIQQNIDTITSTKEDASTSTKAVDPPDVTLQKEGEHAETSQQHQDAITFSKAVDPPDVTLQKEGDPAETQRHDHLYESC
jgi:hypothetical protein